MDEILIEGSQDAEVPGRRTLKLAGSVTVGQAAALKEALLEALAPASELQVDFSGITRIDLTGLQLICAAHRSAHNAGKRFEILACGSDNFRKTAADAGFLRHVGCGCDTTSNCIWVGGEN